MTGYFRPWLVNKGLKREVCLRMRLLGISLKTMAKILPLRCLQWWYRIMG